MGVFKNFIKQLEHGVDYISLTSSYKYVAYLRRSQKEGSFKSQEKHIRDFSNSKKIWIDEWYRETCSGLKKAKERMVFKQVFDYCYETDNVIILVDATDRFSRSKKSAEDLLKLLKLTNAKIYFIKENLLVYPSRNKNVDTLINYIKFANSEVKACAYRLSGGYKNFIESGGKVGRKVGYRKSKEEMEGQYRKEITLLCDDYSLRRIQALTGTSVNTLRKLKKMFCD